MIAVPGKMTRLGGLTALALAVLAAGALALAAPVSAASSKAQQIADHFSSVKSMTGEFVQFGPRGEQTGGTFSLVRPGKIRFDYEAPAQFRVVSDGSHVLLNNRKLKTYETYPLSKTPLKLLL
ncbi:MAG: outer-membrane lipoprotein carrier protein LolA, partial [Notoacmeibacter sp.]|nr:outer-membrane lipoprotein carrier protein LolA [Notoacmeibacter sp.]